MEECVATCNWCNGKPSALQWTEVSNLFTDLVRHRPPRAKFFPTLPPCVKSSFNIVAQERCLRLKWLLRSEEEHTFYLQERWYALITANKHVEFQLALDDCNFSYIQRHMAPSEFTTNMDLMQHLMNRYVNCENFRMQIRSRGNFTTAYVSSEPARRSLWMCAMMTMDVLPSKHPSLFGRKMPMSINPHHDYAFFKSFLQGGYFVRMINHPNLPYWLEQFNDNPLIFNYSSAIGLGRTLTSIFQTLKRLHLQQLEIESEDQPRVITRVARRENDSDEEDDSDDADSDDDSQEEDDENDDSDDDIDENDDSQEEDDIDDDSQEEDDEDEDEADDSQEEDDIDDDSQEEGDEDETDDSQEDDEDNVQHFLALHNIRLTSDQDDDSSRSLSLGDLSDMEREHIPLLELIERDFNVDELTDDDLERKIVVVSPTRNSPHQSGVEE